MPTERTDAYRTLLQETLSEDGLHDIRAYLQQQRVLGRDDFCVMVEAKTRRFAASVRPIDPPESYQNPLTSARFGDPVLVR